MEMLDFNKLLETANWKEEDIDRIYHGGDHVCRCGCAGNYFERGSRGFTRALNALKRGFMTESKGDEVYVSGYGHNEVQISEGIDIETDYINIPEYNAPNHNRCYCLYCK